MIPAFALLHAVVLLARRNIRTIPPLRQFWKTVSRTLYTLLTYAALPLILLRLLWRGRKAPAYRQRWRERLALYPPSHSLPASAVPSVLFHAVSVGEVHAAQPLIEMLLEARPALTIVVTCTTPTGSARVQQLFGARVQHVYLPYDLPGFMRRLLRHFHPALIVLLETELWPNLLQQCRAQGVAVILANARLSERSFQRYRKHAVLSASMVQALDTVVAQAAADGERFVALGLPTARLQVNGSLKFDVAIAAAKVEAGQQLKASWQGRPVWIAASTREGEDVKVLHALRLALQQQPDLLLVLVPRHPERFGEAAAQAADAGFVVQRFSAGGALTADCQVLVGDTMGDMYFYYALADIAFVGGSLVETGCQNLIEPAALGLPVLSGPSLYNFQAVSDLLRQADAQIVVADAEELAAQLVRLCAHPEEARALGQRARAVVAANQGATARLCQLILERLR